MPRVGKISIAMKRLVFFLSFGLGGSLILMSPSAKAHDWHEYGSLKVNLRGWTLNQQRLEQKGEITYDTNVINTSRNYEGYVSINCDRDRINTTKKDGKWRRYRVALRKNEKDLKDDFCTALRANPTRFE